MVDLKVVCEMEFCQSFHFMEPVIGGENDAQEITDTNISYGWGSSSTGYYLYPRSSICKTPLMLANHTGIIDSGYRGHIMAATRCLGGAYEIEQYTRLFQICAPTLCRVFVVLVDEIELTNSERGTGGFGSTNK
jgi:dUTPase